MDERVILAYRNYEWTWAAPPVCTAGWEEEDWMRYVTYLDPELNRLKWGKDDGLHT